MNKRVVNTVNKWSGGFKNTEYGVNLDLWNRTRDIFEWDIEDGLIEKDPGSHPELGDEVPVVTL